MCHPVYHRIFSDLVEDHPHVVGELQAEQLRQMPGDRLALAVGVGREIDLLAALGLLFNGVDKLTLPPNRDVLRLVVVLDVKMCIRDSLSFWGTPKRHTLAYSCFIIPAGQTQTHAP